MDEKQQAYTEPNFFEQYSDKIKTQIEDRLLLLRLQSVKITTKLLMKILMFTMIVLFAFIIVLFLSMMLAFYLSRVFESYYYGFGAVGGIYLLLLIIMIVFRNAIFGNFIMNNITDAIFDKTEKIDTNGN